MFRCVLFSSLFYSLQEYVSLEPNSFVYCFQVYFIIYRNMFRWNQTVLCIVFKFILLFTGICFVGTKQFRVLFSSLFYYLQEYVSLCIVFKFILFFTGICFVGTKQFCVLFSSLFYYLQEYVSLEPNSFVYCFQVYFIIYRNMFRCVLFSSLFYSLQEYVSLEPNSFVYCFQVYFIIYRNMFRWNQTVFCIVFKFILLFTGICFVGTKGQLNSHPAFLKDVGFTTIQARPILSTLTPCQRAACGDHKVGSVLCEMRCLDGSLVRLTSSSK